MKRNSISIRFGLFLVMLQALASYAQDNVIDEVVWVVGDEAIYKSQVEEARLDAQMDGVRFEGDPYCLIPEQIAVNKLFMNQAQLDSIIVTDAEVYEQVNAYYQNMVDQLGSEEKLEERRKMTASQIKERLYEQLYQQMVVSRVQNNIMGKVKVTPADVRRYLKNIPEEEIQYIPPQVEVQIITLDPVIPQEEIDEVKSELRDYAERIQSGQTTFQTLAILYSEDPGSAEHGGDCGFMGKGQMVPEFAAVAFNLTDPSKVSKIVETEYGYHIIQLIERMGDRVRVRHILRKPKVPDESIRDCIARLDTIAADIRTGKKSFEEQVVLYSQDKETKNNKGLMVNQNRPGMLGSSRFQLQELNSQVARVVNDMHVGEVSDPFVMQLSNGKLTCAIVRVKSKIAGHRASMAEDFEILYDMVSGIRQREAIEKWIREKQRTTYVRISPGWDKGDFMYPGWGGK